MPWLSEPSEDKLSCSTWNRSVANRVMVGKLAVEWTWNASNMFM